MATMTLAGSGTSGFADGPGTQARFHNPHGVVVDRDGAVIVADYTNHRVRKIAADGTVTTLAGSGRSGQIDGPSSQASFKSPTGVAIDRQGNVIVADCFNHRVRKIAPDGTVTTLAGSGAAGYADGSGAQARFNGPRGVAIDGDGTVIVADAINHRVRKIAPDGTVTTLAGIGTEGYADGPGAKACFNSPTGVAIDGLGNVIIADSGNHRVRKIAAAKGTVTTLAGSGTAGYADCRGVQACFNRPTCVAVDGEGNVIVADLGNHRVRKIEADGTVTTLAGSGNGGHADRRGSLACFNCPCGVFVDGEGNVIVADSDNHRVRKIYASLAPPATEGPPKGRNVIDDLLKLLHSEEHTDLAFLVEGQLIRAHRLIMIARCEYFKTMLGSQFLEGARPRTDRAVADESDCEGRSGEAVSAHASKAIVSSTAKKDTVKDDAQARTPADDTRAGRPLPIGDTTAPAFRAVLHFVYSNKPLFEPDTLIDQMRCACCSVLSAAAALRQCGTGHSSAPGTVWQVGPSLPDPRVVRRVHPRVHAMRDGTDVPVADTKRAIRSGRCAASAPPLHGAQLAADLRGVPRECRCAEGVPRNQPPDLTRHCQLAASLAPSHGRWFHSVNTNAIVCRPKNNSDAHLPAAHSC